MDSKNNRIYLNKKIYDRESILNAIQDYKEVCSIELSESEEYYCCTVKNQKASFDLIKKEFVNYVTGLGVKSKRCFQL